MRCIKSRYLLLISLSLCMVLLSMPAMAKTKITMWCWPVWDTTMKEILPLFNKLHPDIEVDVVNTGDETHTKLIAAIAAGTGAPDVSIVDTLQISNFMTKGGLEDLSKPPYNAGKYKKDMFSHKWAGGFTPDGRQIGFPPNIAPETMWYRKDLFDKAGIKITEDGFSDWEEYLTAGKKLTRDKNGDGAVDQWMVPHAETIGQQIYNSRTGFFDKNMKPIIDGDLFAKALTIAKRARELKIDAKVKSFTNEWYEGLRRGSFATVLIPAWLGGKLRTYIAPDDIGVWRGAWPPAKMGATSGGVFFVIPSQSKHKEAAWELVRFICTTSEAQKVVFTSGDMLPAYIPTYKDPIFDESVEYFGGQKIRRLWQNIALAIPDALRTPYDVMANDIVYDALTQVLTTGRDPKDALQEAKALLLRRMR